MYSVCILSSIYLCIYIATHLHRVNLDWLQAVLESNLRRTWKRQSSVLGDTLRSRYRASLELHWDAVIERICRDAWRPWWSELRDALRDGDRASLYMHLEAVIRRVWRFTWRPWSSEFGDAFGDRNQASLVIHNGGPDRARLDQYIVPVDGQHAGCEDSIRQLVDLQMWECD